MDQTHGEVGSSATFRIESVLAQTQAPGEPKRDGIIFMGEGDLSRHHVKILI